MHLLGHLPDPASPDPDQRNPSTSHVHDRARINLPRPHCPALPLHLVVVGKFFVLRSTPLTPRMFILTRLISSSGSLRAAAAPYR